MVFASCAERKGLRKKQFRDLPDTRQRTGSASSTYKLRNVQRVAVDKRAKRADARLVSLGAAIKAALDGRSQAWLAKQLNIDDSTVSRIISGKFPELALERVVQIEAVLKLQPGHLFRAGGYVDGDITVPMAIAADLIIGEAAKGSLTWAYQAALTEAVAQR